MNRLKINKKLATLAVMSMAAITSLTGCGKKDVKETKPVDTQAETTTEAVVEEPIIYTELDINNDASIEAIVEESYNTYNEFYTKYGISKDQVRDIVFVLNDKYTDSEGKLIIDEDRASEAYMNIKVIVGQSDDAILQKIGIYK